MAKPPPPKQQRQRQRHRSKPIAAAVPDPTSPPSSSAEAEGVTGFAQWDIEQDYESRPRKKRKHEKEDTRLPIKTADGKIERSRLPDLLGAQDDDDTGSEESSSAPEVEVKHEQAREARPTVSPRQQIIDAKEELAKIAGLLNEDPEENASLFRRLSELGTSRNATVKKLALLTQLAVYKDVIPGYRIRPIDDSGGDGAKVSKEVRRLRGFEQSLVGSYQAYVRELARLARGSIAASTKGAGQGSATMKDDGLASTALTCACTLLTSVPHFNFRSELLQIVVARLSSRTVDADFTRCRSAIETLFQSDDDGTPSLDATALLTKMMKARHYRVHESVLNTLLQLRLLSEFSAKASQSRVDAAQPDDAGKKAKQQRTFRTKKQRKLAKEHKAVAKEMAEADASVSHEERDRMQAETLKMVFVTYFRILKLGVPSLMGAVLEGLGKYAHLINQDFFGDLLEALKDLIRASSLSSSDANEDENGEADADADASGEQQRDTLRESLLCIITAFALLQGQSISLSTHSQTTTLLNLDLHFFITHLYSTLHALAVAPDIELSSRSLRLPDPASSASSRLPSSSTLASDPRSATDRANAEPKINHTTLTVLLLRCLSHALLSSRTLPPTRLAAFTKQLASIALHLPEKSALAVLTLLQRVATLQGRKIAALWRTDERRGDGTWDAAVDAGWDGKNPFAATVWEGELLRLHYAPSVRQAALDLERVVGDVK